MADNIVRLSPKTGSKRGKVARKVRNAVVALDEFHDRLVIRRTPNGVSIRDRNPEPHIPWILA